MTDHTTRIEFESGSNNDNSGKKNPYLNTAATANINLKSSVEKNANL